MIDINKTPKAPAGSRPVTKRELALGLFSKPIYRGDSSCERYMTLDDVVSFHMYNRKSDFNAEFFINGNSHQRIWLSQLNLVYLDSDELELHCGLIRYKNGEAKIMAGMLVEDFVEATYGKQFQVKTQDGLYAIDFRNERCRALATAGAVQDFIKTEFKGERYDNVMGMTKSMVCYSLIEC